MGRPWTQGQPKSARPLAAERPRHVDRQLPICSKTIGLFNRSDRETQMTAKWADLGLKGNQKVRDLWRQNDLGKFKDKFEATVPRHGVVLVRIWPARFW